MRNKICAPMGRTARVTVTLPGSKYRCFKALIKHRVVEKSTRCMMFEHNNELADKVRTELREKYPNYQTEVYPKAVHKYPWYRDYNLTKTVDFVYLDWCGQLVEKHVQPNEDLYPCLAADAVVCATFCRCGLNKSERIHKVSDMEMFLLEYELAKLSPDCVGDVGDLSRWPRGPKPLSVFSKEIACAWLASFPRRPKLEACLAYKNRISPESGFSYMISIRARFDPKG